ncbi:MAG: alpha/beta hydrolase [Faecalibacterium sp.]|nr:alpha/beta hydrolase [Ruminococcus sp.]MCM1393055.1 alpha/beta hydrolase [Ruminococcus sp.]MCM1485685.1 alpha/beta hydrolase [Faecalibacterium sp.]
MKKSLTKVLSVFIAIIMICCAVTPPIFAEENKADDLPIIFIPGRSDTLYNKKTGERIYPVVDDEVQYTKDSAVVIVKALAKALATEKLVGQKAWDEYCDVICDQVLYMFTSIQLDENGNPQDDTGMLWDAETVRVNTKKSGYGLYDYQFQYDWRIDPCESAKQLHTYVERIKKATGHDKVKMYVHCLGGTIFSAYLAEYGSDDIEGVVLSVPTVTGSGTVGALYSNQIVIDPDALSEYATYYLNSSQNRFFEEDPTMIALMTALVTTLNEFEALGIGTDMIMSIYDKVKDNLVPRLVKGVFFFPTYYAMIGEEYYDDCINMVFTGEFGEQYKGFREKIDYYHYNVQVKAEELLEQAKENGTKVSIITRYGFNLLPCFDGAQTLGDGRMEVSKLSYGATTSNMSDTLSDSYIKKAEQNGTAKYISADKKIDASTCLFPDSTWFVRNLYHAGINPIDPIASKLFSSKDQPTVWDYEEYPQYMHFEDGKFTKVEGESDLDGMWVKDRFTAIFRLVMSVIRYVFSLFSKLGAGA